MIITISGKPGSGKTSVAKRVADKLGMRHLSTGDMRGQLAQEHGMTIDELNDVGRREFWTDRIIDERTKKVGKEEDNIVIDSWLAWNFIPHAVKVFLDVDPDEAARRVFRDQRPDESAKETQEEVKLMLKKRWDETAERYLKYYSVDLNDLSNFDHVIDTTGMSIEEVADRIAGIARKHG